MAGIATMAAAVPHSMDGRADVFAAAYLIANGVGTGTLLRAGRVVLNWTNASHNVGLVPWIVSFWFDAERHRRDWRPWRWDDPVPHVEAAKVDAGHLGERLGLFVIIVLGEAVLQIVIAVSEIEDRRPGGGHGWLLPLAAASAFLLLIALWGLNVRHGFAERTSFPPGLVLPAHFAMVASITVVAAGLGTAAAASGEHLNPPTTWLMCGGLSAFLLVVNLLVGHGRWWPVRALLVLPPLVAAVLAPVLPAAVLVAVMAVAAGGQLLAIRSDR